MNQGSKNASDKVFLEDPIWFSPVNVIAQFEGLKQTGKLTPEMPAYQKAYETFVAAVTVLGVMATNDERYYVQTVNNGSSPDARTGCYKRRENDNDFAIQDIEVVTYEDHSNDSLPEFLYRTKLSKSRKSYDELTHIVCHVNKFIQIPSGIELNKSLKLLGPQNQSPVMVVGRVNPTQGIWKVMQIFPELDLLSEFNLLEECKKKRSGNITLRKSVGGPIRTYSATEKHYPFEKFGLTDWR